jgi:TIR domain
MPGKIFLSYRREDDPGFALALFGRLEQSFPTDQLFMDVEGGIKAGEDFIRVLEQQVDACDVMLVLIGAKWLTVTDEMGRRRVFRSHRDRVGTPPWQARHPGACA